MVRRSKRRRQVDPPKPKDRLSSLPDALLVDILNLLPIQTAVQTSILSTRWRYLWTHITNLSFDHGGFPSGLGRWNWVGYFFAAVDRILEQLTSPKIHRFYLDFQYPYDLDEFQSRSSRVASVLHQVCCRHNLEKIKVCTKNRSRLWPDHLVPVPACVVQSQSLTSLSLEGDLSIELPHDGVMVSAVNLSTLNLHLSNLDCHVLVELFKSCPLLEDVNLRGKFSYTGTESCCLDLSAHKLESFHVIVEEDFPARVKFVINVFKLEHLTLHSPCLSVDRFVDIQVESNIKTADIQLQPGFLDRGDYLSHIKTLGRIICGVKSLCVNATTLKALESFVVFDYLTKLTIKFDCPYGSWECVLILLGCCSDLEVLNVFLDQSSETTQVIKWVKHSDVPACLQGGLKTVRLEGLRFLPSEINMIKFILENSSVLELFSLQAIRSGSKSANQISKEHKFCTTVFHLTKRSSTCEIEFEGNRVRATSRDYKWGILTCQVNDFGYWPSEEDIQECYT